MENYQTPAPLSGQGRSPEPWAAGMVRRESRDRVSLADLQRLDPWAVSPLTRDRPLYYFAKRVLDVVISLIALIILAPVMLVVALVTVLDSPGPAIFAQTRVGGRRWSYGGYAYWQKFEFKCLKFRTMVQDADPARHRQFIRALINGEVGPNDSGGAKFKLEQDSRVTRVGRILRKLSLDELPQLFNVLRGEMSLVGPRPDIPYIVELYKPGWHERFAASPGITGYWQTHGRGDVTFEEMVEMDIVYVRNTSLAMDMRILILTIPTVVTGRGAA
jgi:lipopolysaccharide/colanic/teichoic acid biosynthesis glycosyltransferase